MKNLALKISKFKFFGTIFKTILYSSRRKNNLNYESPETQDKSSDFEIWNEKKDFRTEVRLQFWKSILLPM